MWWRTRGVRQEAQSDQQAGGARAGRGVKGGPRRDLRMNDVSHPSGIAQGAQSNVCSGSHLWASCPCAPACRSSMQPCGSQYNTQPVQGQVRLTLLNRTAATSAPTLPAAAEMP